MTNVTIECKFSDGRCFNFTVCGIIESNNYTVKETIYYGFDHLLNNWCGYLIKKNKYHDGVYNMILLEDLESFLHELIHYYKEEDLVEYKCNFDNFYPFTKLKFEWEEIDFISSVKHWIVQV